MATYNFELNCRPSQRGTYVVLFRITENKKHKRIKTSVELQSPNDWNPKKQEVRKSDPNFKVLNQTLKRIREQAEEAVQTLEEEGKGITSQNVAATMQAGKKVFSFITFAEGFAQKTLEAGDYRTYTKYITFLNKLKFFINNISPESISSIPRNGKGLQEYIDKLRKDLLFNEITLSFLNKFKTYLQRIPNAKNNELTLHQNTINKQFDNFKSLYNKGLVELREDGLFLRENPFKDFECSTIESSKEKLTMEEIKALTSLELPENSLLWHTRNCFLFAFYCGGMRAGDLIQLRGNNIIDDNGIWRVRYRMDKTSTPKSIKLIPSAKAIIEKYINLNQRNSNYIFPLLDNEAPYAKATTWEEKEQLPYEIKTRLLQTVNGKNSLLNKYLNKLAAMAGIEKKISMHIARHSFANIAREEEANVYDISNDLGHSNIDITKGYLAKFDTRSEDETIDKIFESESINEDLLLKQLRAISPEKLKELLAKRDE